MPVFTDMFAKCFINQLETRANNMLRRVPASMDIQEFLSAMFSKSDLHVLVRAAYLMEKRSDGGEFGLLHNDNMVNVLYKFGHNYNILLPGEKYFPNDPAIIKPALETQLTLGTGWQIARDLFVLFNTICTTGSQLALHLPWVKQALAVWDVPTPIYYSNDHRQCGVAYTGTEHRRDTATHKHNLKQRKDAIEGKSDSFISLTREQRELCKQSGQVFAQEALLYEVTQQKPESSLVFLFYGQQSPHMRTSSVLKPFFDDHRFT